jgi:hypothetical protein
MTCASRGFSFALLVVLEAGCSRSFPAPTTTTAPPLVSVANPVARGDGTVLLRPHDVAVISGAVHLKAIPDPKSGPIGRVDFWTPGRVHQDGDSDLGWDVDSRLLYPTAGVMTVYVTPFDQHDRAASSVQRSYIVDNAPPVVTVQSPAPGTTLPPGPFNLVFCARDREDVTKLPVEVWTLLDGGHLDQYATTDAGPGCFASAPITLDLDGSSSADLEIVAGDDVNNVSRTHVNYGITRELRSGVLPGILKPGLSVSLSGIGVAFASGYGLRSSGPFGDSEVWVGAAGLVSRLLSADDPLAIPVPGSQNLFFEVHKQLDGGLENLRFVRAFLEDGGFEDVDAGERALQPASVPGAATVEAGPRASCFAPERPAGAGELACILTDGGLLSAPLPAVSGAVVVGGLASNWVFLEYGDQPSHVARYDLSNGLARSADIELDAGENLGIHQTATSIAGALVRDDAINKLLRFDVASGVTEVLPPASRLLSPLAAGIHGGTIYAVPQRRKVQVDIEEDFLDGGALSVGCLGPNQGIDANGSVEVGIVVYRDGHVLTASRDSAAVPHFRMFGPGARFEWEWAGFGPQLFGNDPVIIADPLGDLSDPSASVLLVAQDRYVLLDARDPLHAPPDPCVH